MFPSRHIHQLLTAPPQDREPLLQTLELCGLSQPVIAKHLGVSQPTISIWATGKEPLPPARRAELEALAREVFLSALEETRIFFNANPTLYRTDSAKRWRQRLARASKLLHAAGVEL